MYAAYSNNTIIDSFPSLIHQNVIHSRKTMDQNEATMKTKEFHETFKIDAEIIVFQKIPERLVYFYELLNKPESCTPTNNIECEFDITTIIAKLKNNVKNYADGKTPYDTVLGQMLIPFNKNVTEFFEIIKSNIVQLLEDNRVLKMWVTLSIPKTESDNNFGVYIQTSILSLIQLIESVATMYFGKLSRYYEYRGKLITKVVKYPFIEDYRVAVKEFDEKQNIDFYLITRQIYYCYTVLHDVIIKNFEKIKNPRSSNCLY
ncbi:proteasome activator complex subunit 3-like [Melanaphis sacchari]|uniref:Proteasome activator complex subunit 3 n=1 Tax=Melanaphis sacchari TaxID=742174 RepID=A0A2H8TI78_9HEMI|nr:proteasome activator complex subunit 3-like [Melanaphis sacchari]